MEPISADSHVVEGKDVFTGLAEKFGDEAPRIMTIEDEADLIVVPEHGMRGVNVARMGMAATRLSRNEPLNRSRARKPDVGHMKDPELVALFRNGYVGLRSSLVDGSQRYKDQHEDGLAAEFLHPGYLAMFSQKNLDLLVAIQKNYNDWLYDYTKDSNGRLFGLPAIPVQRPDEAVKEMNRVINMGFRGGCIPCTSPPNKPYYDEMYTPVWNLAADAGFLLSMHVGCTSYLPREHRIGKRRNDGIAGYATSQNTVQYTIVEFMCRGVCERHPNLQIVVAEFNAGWIAHWLYRVELGLQRERRNLVEPYTSAPPHEVWQRQFYATIEDDRAALATRDLIGVDRLMWASDYPHTDSTWPCSREVLDELFEGISDIERVKITRENAARLYGLA